MSAAIKRGPHVSALVQDAMVQLDAEVQEKVRTGQARLVKWNDIKHNPPPGVENITHGNDSTQIQTVSSNSRSLV